ncbi:V-type proton ATPase subunit H, partial [Xenoophorus captivus]
MLFLFEYYLGKAICKHYFSCAQRIAVIVFICFACRSQMISTEDCEFIKKFEKATSEEKQVILTQEGHQCAKTFLNLMAHISKEQTVQYILTLIDDTLQENHQRVNIFFDYAKKTKNTAWSYFLPMLNRQDLFTVHM